MEDSKIKNRRVILIICLYSIIFAFFLGLFTNNNFEAFSLKQSNVKDVASFELPRRDTYLLSIWNPSLPQAVYFNGSQLTAKRISKRKDYTLYFVISNNNVHTGLNNLEIVGPSTYSLKIKNYITASKFSNIYILHKSSGFVTAKKFNFWGFGINLFLAFLFLSFVWSVVSSLDSFIFTSYSLSFIPCILLYIIISGQFLTPYRIVLSGSAYLGLTLFLIGIVLGPVVFIALFKKFKNGSSAKDKSLPQGPIIKIIRISFAYILKDFSNSFFILFMFLLFLSFWMIIFKLDAVAELVINIAFIVLLIGTLMKSFKLINKQG